MTQQHYSQYVDPGTGIIQQPGPWGDPFGDAVWRTSWFYSSLIVIRALAPAEHSALAAAHGVDAAQAGLFLSYFRGHCLGDDGWEMPKNPGQEFSRDQLIPLLYLLEAVSRFAPEFQGTGAHILRSLVKLEEQGKGVSATTQGAIGRNIGYMIDVLCDKERYDINYRSSDFPIFLAPCLGNVQCAEKNRRGAYKTLFSLALEADQLGGWVASHGLDAADEYSVFNALAAVSLQCLAWGKDDSDVKAWRANFTVHADDGWGPAFQIVSGRGVSAADIDAWADAHVTRSLDNDIISAQRPTKIRDGTLTSGLKGGTDQFLVLDYVILTALHLLWS